MTIYDAYVNCGIYSDVDLGNVGRDLEFDLVLLFVCKLNIIEGFGYGDVIHSVDRLKSHFGVFKQSQVCDFPFIQYKLGFN